MSSLTDAPIDIGNEAGQNPLPFSIDLDPFDYVPRRRSVLGPFGGDDRVTDPSYAFHTHYVEPPVGAAAFTIRLRDVKATCGTLNVRIHVVPSDHSSEARLLKTASVSLDSFAESGGEIAYRIVAQPGKSYAAVGLVLDETDVVCSSVEISVNTVDDDTISIEDLAEARRSVFTNGAVSSTPHVLSLREPSLAYPASQICTDRQLTEPAYRQAMKELGEKPAAGGLAEWNKAFVLCALRQYGMLRAGGDALAFSRGGDALTAIAAASGCEVTQVVLPDRDGGETAASFRYPHICDDTIFDQRVSITRAAPLELPKDMRGYDFLWSTDYIPACGSIEEASEFVSRAMFRLALGGIAVHTFDLRLDANDEIGGNEPRLVLRRRHLERLVFKQLAANHDVCQIRYGGARFGAYGRKPDPVLQSRFATEKTGSMTVTSFGMVIRRNVR